MRNPHNSKAQTVAYLTVEAQHSQRDGGFFWSNSALNDLLRCGLDKQGRDEVRRSKAVNLRLQRRKYAAEYKADKMDRDDYVALMRGSF